MDHSVKAMNSHRKVAFSRLLNRSRFENMELELLYQRYIFKLQQSSIISVLVLFSLLTVTLAILQFYYQRTITLIGLYCAIQFIAFIGLFLISFKMQDTQLLALCYVILLFCVLFSLIFAPVNINMKTDELIEEEEQEWSLMKWWHRQSNPSEGIWQSVFVIFLTYTMLPIKTRIALFIGLFLSSFHIGISFVDNHHFTTESLYWQQVRQSLYSTFIS